MLFKPEVGSVYEVKVIKLLDFGAVVEYCEAPGNEVLLHISELAWEKTENVTDVVNLGDTLDVKYFGIDQEQEKKKFQEKLYCLNLKVMLISLGKLLTETTTEKDLIKNK